MRTNIDIDDDLMAQALAAGPFKTKREAVEAGLRLLERQAAARELLKLEGKLPWGWGDEQRLSGQPNWSYATPPVGDAQTVQEPSPAYRSAPAAKPAAKAAAKTPAKTTAKRHARR